MGWIAKKFLVVWVLFIIFALASGGGGLLRSLSGDAGIFLQALINVVADKADSLKEESEGIQEKIREWTGRKQEIARHYP
ncbi:MAG: hypothetical protein K8I29_08510 [Alphaproteobacteria bacterium]|uniref:Uncharacterized protein n=1 Tax=Candidatus Nitrobium versatile TaxID=2884831 RepID=A0A953JCI2_9BACT|nr:hypothetical protein [Candidatus Nitrobium versatile]